MNTQRFEKIPFERDPDKPLSEPMPPDYEIVFVDTGFVYINDDLMAAEKAFAKELYDLSHEMKSSKRIKILRMNCDSRDHQMERRIVATVAVY